MTVLARVGPALRCGGLVLPRNDFFVMRNDFGSHQFFALPCLAVQGFFLGVYRFQLLTVSRHCGFTWRCNGFVFTCNGFGLYQPCRALPYNGFALPSNGFFSRVLTFSACNSLALPCSGFGCIGLAFPCIVLSLSCNVCFVTYDSFGLY